MTFHRRLCLSHWIEIQCEAPITKSDWLESNRKNQNQLAEVKRSPGGDLREICAEWVSVICNNVIYASTRLQPCSRTIHSEWKEELPSPSSDGRSWNNTMKILIGRKRIEADSQKLPFNWIAWMWLVHQRMYNWKWLFANAFWPNQNVNTILSAVWAVGWIWCAISRPGMYDCCRIRVSAIIP